MASNNSSNSNSSDPFASLFSSNSTNSGGNTTNNNAPSYSAAAYSVPQQSAYDQGMTANSLAGQAGVGQSNTALFTMQQAANTAASQKSQMAPITAPSATSNFGSGYVAGVPSNQDDLKQQADAINAQNAAYKQQQQMAQQQSAAALNQSSRDAYNQQVTNQLAAQQQENLQNAQNMANQQLAALNNANALKVTQIQAEGNVMGSLFNAMGGGSSSAPHWW